MAMRLHKNVERASRITLVIDGKAVSAYAGETIAAILLVEDIDVFYRTADNRARGLFCNMGTCFECRVRIERADSGSTPTWARACMTVAEQGMTITTGSRTSDADSRHDKD